MGFKSLEEMEVWKRGCRMAMDVYKMTKGAEFDKDWGLRDQIRRSAVSIPSNVAEGFERETHAEFKRFLYVSKGSCGELRTQIYLAQGLKYITKDQAAAVIAECREISAMLAGLIRSLGITTKAKSKP